MTNAMWSTDLIQLISGLSQKRSQIPSQLLVLYLHKVHLSVNTTANQSKASIWPLLLWCHPLELIYFMRTMKPGFQGNSIIKLTQRKTQLVLSICCVLSNKPQWVKYKSTTNMPHYSTKGKFTASIFVLTQWGREKKAATFQTTFSNAFSWMKIYEFQLRFHWGLFLSVQLTMFQHWFR